jgi:hypothetical protein
MLGRGPLALVLVAACGCADAGQRDAGSESEDRSSDAVQWSGELVRMTAAMEPAATLGSFDGDEDYLFGAVWLRIRVYRGGWRRMLRLRNRV